MKIQKEIINCQLTVIVEGRRDTITSPQLEQELQESLPGITNLILDFDKLEYISSIEDSEKHKAFPSFMKDYLSRAHTEI